VFDPDFVSWHKCGGFFRLLARERRVKKVASDQQQNRKSNQHKGGGKYYDLVLTMTEQTAANSSGAKQTEHVTLLRM